MKSFSKKKGWCSLTINYCVDHKENFQKVVSFGVFFRLKKIKGTTMHSCKFILHRNKYSTKSNKK